MYMKNLVGGVMVSVLASSAVDRGFEPRSGQTKDYQICICCISHTHAVFKSKSKDVLARNQYNVSEWSDMFTCVRASVSQHYKIPTKHVGLVQSRHHRIVMQLALQLRTSSIREIKGSGQLLFVFRENPMDEGSLLRIKSAGRGVQFISIKIATVC